MMRTADSQVATCSQISLSAIKLSLVPGKGERRVNLKDRELALAQNRSSSEADACCSR